MPTRQRRCMKRRFSVDLAGRSDQRGNLPEGSDQFNSLQEKLIERFAELREQSTVFSCRISPAVAIRLRSRHHSVFTGLRGRSEIATEFLYIDVILVWGKKANLRICRIRSCEPVRLSVGIMLREMFSTAGRCRRALAGTGPKKHYLHQKRCCRCCGDAPTIRICCLRISPKTNIRHG